jgi:ABC-type multidrug transport system fused ATPase/permease subunit
MKDKLTEAAKVVVEKVVVESTNNSSAVTNAISNAASNSTTNEATNKVVTEVVKKVMKDAATNTHDAVPLENLIEYGHGLFGYFVLFFIFMVTIRFYTSSFNKMRFAGDVRHQLEQYKELKEEKVVLVEEFKEFKQNQMSYEGSLCSSICNKIFLIKDYFANTPLYLIAEDCKFFFNRSLLGFFTLILLILLFLFLFYTVFYLILKFTSDEHITLASLRAKYRQKMAEEEKNEALRKKEEFRKKKEEEIKKKEQMRKEIYEEMKLDEEIKKKNI